ncbi:hypothetical protein EMCRGX_G009189 [Ephydatia muelleri]
MQSSKRQRYQKDLEENRAAKRQRYQEDLEENRAAKRQKYEDNSAAVKASEKSWYWNDPDAVRLAKRMPFQTRPDLKRAAETTRYSWGYYHDHPKLPQRRTTSAVLGQKGNFGYVSEGVQCIVSTEPGPGLKPLYRYWNGKEHFYTTNAKEIATGQLCQAVTGNYGYKSEGIAAYCYATRRLNTVPPLHRYYNGVHFYTTNENEIGNNRSGNGRQVRL